MKRTMTVALLTAAAVLAIFLLAACSSGGGTPASSGSSGGSSSGGSAPAGSAATAVTIQNFAFSPSSVEVKVGGSVTWTNQDSATHDVEGSGGISSGPLAQGKSYTAKFDTAGSYPYKCAIHPSMTGTVVVK